MDKKDIPHEPLAERIRPKSLDDFQGQEALLGKGKPLRLMIEGDNTGSFILWGPPGTGKTTIAKIIAEHTRSDFFQLNAVSSGVKDVRAVIETAKKNKSLDTLNKWKSSLFSEAQANCIFHSNPFCSAG